MIAVYIVASLALWLIVAAAAGVVTGKSIRHADTVEPSRPDTGRVGAA